MFSLMTSSDLTLTLILDCLALAKACKLSRVEEWHHNAGVDARHSLLSIIKMMMAYPGATPFQEGHDMPNPVVYIVKKLQPHWLSNQSEDLRVEHPSLEIGNRESKTYIADRSRGGRLMSFRTKGNFMTELAVCTI
jgi:hypothetical protein